MSVSDKELLTFCNLANLKMEFAHYNKNEADPTLAPDYHTIYSHIKKQVGKLFG